MYLLLIGRGVRGRTITLFQVVIQLAFQKFLPAAAETEVHIYSFFFYSNHKALSMAKKASVFCFISIVDSSKIYMVLLNTVHNIFPE